MRSLQRRESIGFPALFEAEPKNLPRGNRLASLPVAAMLEGGTDSVDLSRRGSQTEEVLNLDTRDGWEGESRNREMSLRTDLRAVHSSMKVEYSESQVASDISARFRLLL